jgi:hypothetical protein
MVAERRGENNQLPGQLDEVLNEAQLFTLKRMEHYGWILAFIRRPLFQETVTVLRHQDCHKFGVLNDDGTLDSQPGIELRRLRDSASNNSDKTSAA